VTLLHSILLGVLEGATEFLPISSTGHLVLASHLLGIPPTSSFTSFEIAIQLGAIAAVVVLYWRSFLDLHMLLKLAVAFLPTALVGFLVYPFVKGFLLASPLVVVCSLFIGGVVLIAFELLHHEPEAPIADGRRLTYLQAALVGLCQSVAIIPGVSRSGATILGGLALGMGRAAIVEFSFLLAVPTMVAATGYDILKSAHAFSTADIGFIAVGLLVSFVVALGSMRFLLAIVRRHSFIPFGIYRIVLAVVFFLLIL